MTSLYKVAAEMEEKGELGAFCSIIETHGSVPRHEGSKMIVTSDGQIIGSVGGGEIESRVIAEAMDAIKTGKARVLHYELVDPNAGDPGICGGQADVVVEPLHPKPILLIIGAGHVGKALAHLAKWMGWRVLISDDRAEFCTPQNIPDAEEHYPISMADLPSKIKFTRNIYIVLTTRGLVVDVEGLPRLVETDARYIGVIGSKRRWITARKKMMEQGLSEEKLKRVYSPIGLEIKAETPEEIAVSIMAELMMIKNQASGASMSLNFEK